MKNRGERKKKPLLWFEWKDGAKSQKTRTSGWWKHTTT